MSDSGQKGFLHSLNHDLNEFAHELRRGVARVRRKRKLWCHRHRLGRHRTVSTEVEERWIDLTQLRHTWISRS